MNTDVEELAPAVRSILAAARDRAAARSRADRGDDGAGRVSVDARSLPAAVVRAERDGRVPVVAEVKPTSPTTEGERTDDPVELASEMVAGGAAALSVLTEPEHFGGSTDTLRRVRDAVDVPVLRKDFIVDDSQLDDVEADVVLLIVRFVGDDLPALLAAAHERGFQVLVETHTPEEVARTVDAAAGSAGTTVIGVNNRDLGRLEVDLGTFERVAPHVPEEFVLVAESGIHSPGDVARMRRAGADALLVGTAIMDGDVRANTERLTATETSEVSDE